MALSNTAQPINTSLRKIAAVVATAVAGMSAYAQAAETPKKEETITVTAAPAAQESAWGPAATIAARQSATGTKTDTPIQKVPQSISVVTAEEMALHQPRSVKEALSYTPGGAVGTRGASNTYDYLVIRGFAADGQSQNNYLDGMKMQGNFYNDAVIDPYMLERAEIMRGPVSVLYGKSSPGGLLNMVSKRPTTEPLKEIQFKAGTDSLFQTGFDFSDAIDDDGDYSYRLTRVQILRSSKIKASSVMPSRHHSPGVRMIKRLSPSSPTSRTSLKQVITAGCQKRERLIRCQTATDCRRTSTKVRGTIPIPVTRKWWGIASTTNLTTPLPCGKTCVLPRTKPRKTAFTATAYVPIRQTAAANSVLR